MLRFHLGVHLSHIRVCAKGLYTTLDLKDIVKEANAYLYRPNRKKEVTPKWKGIKKEHLEHSRPTFSLRVFR
jgi:hypothetical protein